VVSKTRMETFTLFAIFNLCLCNVIYINDSRLSDICELLNSIIHLAIIFLIALLKLFFSIGFCLFGSLIGLPHGGRSHDDYGGTVGI
jgi:hypothetical protein